jgi:hypothetical protein
MFAITSKTAGHVVEYRVGATTTSPDGDDVQPCVRGLHFCPKAMDCLIYYNFFRNENRRLLRVSVPVGSVVATDDDIKYAASALTVVADVTADVRRLLTGAHARPSYGVTTYYEAGVVHRNEGDQAASVRRATDSTSKMWVRRGRLYKGCLGKYSSVVRFSNGETRVSTPDGVCFQRVRDDSELALLQTILDRLEPFETAA